MFSKIIPVITSNLEPVDVTFTLKLLLLTMAKDVPTTMILSGRATGSRRCAWPIGNALT